MASGTKAKRNGRSRTPAKAVAGCYARTQAELAWVFGISVQAIRNDLANGAPAKGEHGFSLRDWVAWRSDDDESAEVSLRKKRAEARMAELQVAQREAALLDRSAVEDQLAQVGQLAKGLFERAGRELPRELIGKKPNQMVRAIANYFAAAGQQVANEVARTIKRGGSAKDN